MSNKFKISHRRDGSWYIQTPYMYDRELLGDTTHYGDVIAYVNDFTKFLDEEVFEDDIISHYLSKGATWGDMAEYADTCGFSDDIKETISGIYNKAQAWVDRQVVTEIDSGDINKLKALIYSVRDTNNVDNENRKSYMRVLTLLKSLQEFEEL